MEKKINAHEEEEINFSAEDDVTFAAEGGAENDLEESMRDNQDAMESSEYAEHVADDSDAFEDEEDEGEEENPHGLENASKHEPLIHSKREIEKAMRHAKDLFIAKSSPADIEFFTNNILLLAQLKENFERETMELVHNYRQKLGKVIRNEDQEIDEEPPQKKMNIEVVDLENSPIKMATLETEPAEDHNE